MAKFTVLTEREIELMRESNRLLGIFHDELSESVRPGISTGQLDEIAEKLIAKLGGVPNFKGYEGYPACICASVNDEIVHGIPSRDRILNDGDIISIDAGLIYQGYHSDAARTWAVGQISPEAQKLMDVTRESFFRGIEKARAGCRLYDIGNAVADYVTPFGYGIVRELTGHGIGTEMHMEPMIPNYHKRFRGKKLLAGMTLAVEPMIVLGREDVEFLPDGWTVVTSDGSWAAHYENTILVTEGEAEILSMGEKEKTIPRVDLQVPAL